MPLHPQLQAQRAHRAAEGTPPLYELTLAQARAADLAAIRAGAGTGERVHQLAEETIPGPDGDLPVRVYRPDAVPGRPVLLYFFGGGWTLGSLDTGDAVCRSLANAAGCVTIAVGYRLAPENPFPAAVHDCYAALCWAAGNAARFGGDPARLAVAGDSAGGNLAAATTLLARDRGGPAIRHQVLVYPNTDHRADTPSARENTDPLLFNRHSVAWYWGHYLAGADGTDPLASPLRAADLGGLPQATVVTAEYDPLRDEGERYADRLRDAGVAVAARRYDGMAHGFFTMTGVLAEAREAHAWIAGRLRTALDAPACAPARVAEGRP
jgi:acetyl esterase